MNKKVSDLIASGDLEEYLLGTLPHHKAKEIEQYLVLYPALKTHFKELENQLEAFSNAYKKTPNAALKTSINRQVKRIDRLAKWSWGAMAVSLLVFLSATLYLYEENKKLSEKQLLTDLKITQFSQSFSAQLEEMRKQYIVLNNPQTKVIHLSQQWHENTVKLTAYINAEKRMGYLEFNALPKLPENKCYQLWYERNGIKQSIGILPETIEQQLIAIPYKEKAVGYLSIENKPGNRNPKAKNALLRNIPLG